MATGVYGIVNTLSTLPALFLIDRLGRRPLLFSGAIGCAICLFIVGAIVGTYGDGISNHKAAGYAGMVFIYIYDINFSYSWAPIGWVYPSEIFPIGIRSKALAISTSSTWANNFIIGLVTPDMFETLGYGTYVFFGCWAVVAVIFTYFFVPETKGKSLEEMDMVFGDNAAHDEKIRLAEIAAAMGLTDALPEEKVDHARAAEQVERKV